MLRSLFLTPIGPAQRLVMEPLRSDVFDLHEATSAEAERVLVAARVLVRSRSPALAEIRAVDATSRMLLLDLDPFLVRWGAFTEDVLGVRVSTAPLPPFLPSHHCRREMSMWGAPPRGRRVHTLVA